MLLWAVMLAQPASRVPDESVWIPVFAAWVVSLVATMGSLFFSEVMRLPPCVLCWYQRIGMYPLAVMFTVALVTQAAGGAGGSGHEHGKRSCRDRGVRCANAHAAKLYVGRASSTLQARAGPALYGNLIDNEAAMSEAVGFLPPAIDGDPVRACLESLREGFQIISFDWTYVYVNPAAARHGRRDATELIGKPIADMYPGIERTDLFELMRKCMSERTPHIVENLFTFPDGTRRWFELRIQPVPAGICIYSSDIDDRKRRELERGAGAAASKPGLLLWLRQLLGR